MTSLGNPERVNFQHNTKHITVVLFLTLLTKCVASAIAYSYSFGETSCGRPQNILKRRPSGDVLGTSPGRQY